MKLSTVVFLALLNAGLVSPKVFADDSVIVGSVRVQCLSDSLVRLEQVGPEGFEDRPTFHVVNRDWPGASITTNLADGQVLIATANYTVHVPAAATSLTGIYVTSITGQTNFVCDDDLRNSRWLPGPSDHPIAWSFADTPRLIPPAWGLTPAPEGSPLASTSGWNTNNDAPDVYVFLPGGSYRQLRHDFLKLTGPSGMIPLYAFGSWDSRWYDYTESTALAQIDNYRARFIPLDVLVCDTGWRLNASTGYKPNTSLFPDLPRFFAAAHAKNVRVMFNDHPEPVASSALDPREIAYRFSHLTELLNQGLDIWWYDRNWNISLFSPSPKLRHEVWGMRVYHDATAAAKPTLRPTIMVNVDGIDNGIRRRPMDVAAHTYPIQWTGDIGPSMTYLRYAVENAVHSGVQSLFPYESDDLGGHVSNPTPEGYIRWMEYGALSPIYRPHCTYNLTRMPWTFGDEAEWTSRRLINLRYRLLPVFYAAAHENYETGEPILRRLDLDYPQYPEASREDQYLLGHSILVAPVINDATTTIPASWLTTSNDQPGLNATYFANLTLTGTPNFIRTDRQIDFDWHRGSPGGSVPAENFTVRWTGNITIPADAGDVTLAALSDDGVRVWANGRLCLNNWGPGDSVTTFSTNILRAGHTYPLRVDYLQLGGNDLITLKWRTLNPTRTLWIPPGTWINAWTGATVDGPTTVTDNAPLDQVPLYLKSGSVLALAPQMQYTGQKAWDPITLDVYANSTQTGQTTLYEDDTLTTAYQQGQFRTTPINSWTDDSTKTISVAIGAAQGSYSNALTQRSWTVRLHRPPQWPDNLAPSQVLLNGQPVGPTIRHVKNTTAMPIGADNGTPDADVFEVNVPASSVQTSNILVATFAPVITPWTCGDIGCVGAQGNVMEGSSLSSNSVWLVRGGGTGMSGTSDSFHFLYQTNTDDAQLTVFLSGQQSTNAEAVAGIMFRENLDAPARNVMIALTADNHLVFQNRSVTGHHSQAKIIPGFTGPCWLRLLRHGDSFVASASMDGKSWTHVAKTTISGFNPQACLGLAVSNGNSPIHSVDNAQFNLATFAHLLTSPAANISSH